MGRLHPCFIAGQAEPSEQSELFSGRLVAEIKDGAEVDSERRAYGAWPHSVLNQTMA